jgi:hypothetical protein
MYPNPAGENISLQSLTFNHQNMVVEIHDLNGRKLIEKHFKIDNETIEMDISKLKSGVYFYRLVFENKIITKKIIKQ